MHFSTLTTLAAGIAGAHALSSGFNYGATKSDQSTPMMEADYAAQFARAKTLQGTNGEFTSARLYSMIQGSTTDDPSQAFEAAIKTKTTLLLGVWCSAGQSIVTDEINALKSAIQQYGSAFTDLVVGISVGSEDLYRVSPTGIKNKSGLGASPTQLVSYINQVKKAIAGTSLSGTPIGHVDTWTAWVNGSNSAVTDAVDWLGMDTYPYFQTTDTNGIEQAKKLFFNAYEDTKNAAGGKEVWIAETGWPVSGKTSGEAVPSIKNAETYWKEVACEILGTYNTWWFTLDDSIPTTPNPSFGIIAGENLNSAPLYDLSCKKHSKPHTTKTGSGKKHHQTGKPNGNGNGNGHGHGKENPHGNGSGYGHGHGGSPYHGHGNSTGPNSTGGVAHPTGYPGSGNGPAGSPTGSGPSASGTGAPFSGQTGGSAGRVNAAAGAGILAIFALVFAL